jgi:hypothetical protein
MSALAIPNTFVAGNTITAAGHNQNNSAIQTYINDRNSGSASWDNFNATAATITTLTLTNLSFIPSGTKMVFYQASAPTGWTAVAVNDKFLRVVTAGGTGGTTGGTHAASTTLAHSHTVTSHTHSISADGAHTHAQTAGSSFGSATLTRDVASDGSHSHTGATGGATPGTDTQFSGAFAYADIIIATKD